MEQSNRASRSRANSLTDCQVLTFDKPQTVTKQGTYFLRSADSECSISLFDSIFPVPYLQQLRNSIEQLSTLKQYSNTYNGSTQPIPRLSAWYGPVDYTFSGLTMTAHGVSEAPSILAAYQHISTNILSPNNIPDKTDSFLINKYRNGRDSCGEHSDNEDIIDQNNPIITLSLGFPRVMQIRESCNPGNAISITLQPGSVLVMNGAKFQENFKHQIPKEPSCNLSRTSITFRTCCSAYLAKYSGSSVALSSIQVLPSLLTINNSNALLIKAPKRLSTSKPSSPLAGSPKSPSSIKSDKSSDSRSSKPDHDCSPLSLAALVEAVGFFKDDTIKQELTRYGLTTSGSLADKRKRLKKAVQDSYKKLAVSHQPAAQPESLIHSIDILETSISDLQIEVANQSSNINLALLERSTKKPAPPTTCTSTPFNELRSMDRRLENIEDLLGTLKYQNKDICDVVSDCSKDVTQILSQSTESCHRLRSMPKQEAALPKSTNIAKQEKAQTKPIVDKQHSNKNRQRKGSLPTQNSADNPKQPSPKRKRKVLLIHDSQLKEFDNNNFSSAFQVERFFGGKYKDIMASGFSKIISKENIDCYVLQLGVNDFRYNKSSKTLDEAVTNTKETVNRLLARSKGKIVVCLPTPTPGDLQATTAEYVSRVSAFIDSTRSRGSENNHLRLFTVNNQRSFLRAIDLSHQEEGYKSPIGTDNLHLNDYGIRKLCSNIKFTLYRAFGMKQPMRTSPPGREK